MSSTVPAMEVAIRMDRPYEDTVLYDPSVIKDVPLATDVVPDSSVEVPPLYRLCREPGMESTA